MAKRFSDRFETYEDWLRQANDSPYTRAIIQRHAQFPKATLSALKIRSISKIPLWKRHTDSLVSSKQQQTRDRALHWLSLVRKGNDPKTTLDENELTLRLAQLYLGSIISIRGGRIIVKRRDRLTRRLKLYTNGKQIEIVTNDSLEASKIGRYFSAVGRLKNEGDYAALIEFEGMTVIDENGIEYEFETDPDKVLEIEAGREDEFFDVYGGGT